MSSILKGYGGQAASPVIQVTSAPQAQSGTGSLPFTGLYLGTAIGLGICLLVCGIGMRLSSSWGDKD